MRASRDTSAPAGAMQLAAFRRLEPALRLALACEMSDETRAIAEAGMRQRHPDWSADRLRSATRDLLLGDELAHRLRSPRRLPTP